uniref:Uncharacterized protein n=1 Tax=Aegilops tauschii subsp. strangulata TaxID=200361 RepID=A0A453FSU7_AEGTS
EPSTKEKAPGPRRRYHNQPPFSSLLFSSNTAARPREGRGFLGGGAASERGEENDDGNGEGRVDDGGGGGGGEQRAEGRGGGAQPAAGLPLPPHGRRARRALPLQEGGRPAAARAHHRRGRSLQVQPLGSAREGAVREQGVVLLHAARPQVPQRLAPQPLRRHRLLEGHGRRQARGAQGERRPDGRHQEGARLLLRQGAQGRQDRLDHARVPHRRSRPRARQEGVPQGNPGVFHFAVCSPTILIDQY